MSRPILILVAGDPVPSAKAQFGGFDALIQRGLSGAWVGPLHTLDLREDPVLPPPESLAGVVVSGSAARISDGTPWILRGLQYLERLTQAGTPTLGICFGHQMLGSALGGAVTANPSGREIGTVSLRVLADNPLVDSGVEVKVNATHLDSVVSLPSGATNFARTELEANALIHFGARSWGVQFHPEIDRAVIRCYIEERRRHLEEEGLDPGALAARAEDTPLGRGVLSNFVQRLVLQSD